MSANNLTHPNYQDPLYKCGAYRQLDLIYAQDCTQKRAKN